MLISEKMKKAFTITELMVAVAVLAITMAGVSTIFKISITAYRTSSATAEVMRNLRAITDQLDADFKSIRKEMPIAATFTVNESADGQQVRLDTITFFSNGDFQSVRQYSDPPKTVVGNVAAVFYGQSAFPDPNSFVPDVRRQKILARKQDIFTFDLSLPDPNGPGEYLEYAKGSLAEWKVNPPLLAQWLARPTVMPQLIQHVPIFMAKGVDNFTIQLLWDPAANDWWPDNVDLLGGPLAGYLSPYPSAIKFTFTLYDSKGVLEKGMTFTHIVYLED